jgi:LysM repeat protein
MGSTTRTVHATRSSRSTRSLHRTASPVRGWVLRRPQSAVARPQGTKARVARALPSTAVHLTRRGRLVVLLALVALLFAAFSIGRAGTQAATVQGASSPRAVAPAVVQTTVQPGETLWQLAHRVAPGTDPREVVRRIRSLNHLRGSGLQAGQQLLLPA